MTKQQIKQIEEAIDRFIAIQHYNSKQLGVQEIHFRIALLSFILFLKLENENSR